ncbi:helix-turn-helix transcriptional regulator [Actinoplanes sp. NPDC049596]|uniref:helix-turn-helix transcriptional regulator n=1 Tax=unclassified Actinoplanes TaxID=2626549 RepID=UPI0034333C06
MNSYAFTIVMNRRPTDDELKSLFAHGRDDAAYGVENGLPIAEFDREAPTMAEAIASAVKELDAVGIRALRLIDQDLLTLADLADKLGLSREAVRRYSTGERGPGGFPPPVSPTRSGTTFYRWSEVAPWARQRLDLDVPDVDAALVVANLLLQARQHRDQVPNLVALTDLLTS